jgi:hypothetical protein
VKKEQGGLRLILFSFFFLFPFFFLFFHLALQDSFDGVAVKDGMTFLMMGTPGELPVAPTEKVDSQSVPLFFFLFFF